MHKRVEVSLASSATCPRVSVQRVGEAVLRRSVFGQVLGRLVVDGFRWQAEGELHGIENPWDVDLVVAFRNFTGDPEVHLATWLRMGRSASVASTHQRGGVVRQGYRR